MSFRILPPQNTVDELDAFEAVCGQLSGFDAALNFEQVDGFLTALAAGPSVPPVDDWLTALCGDTFDRVHADPDSRAAALRPLQRRLKLLCLQLDPEALFQAPDSLRLEPMVAEWTDAERQRLVDEAGESADDAAAMQTGAQWALGFTRAVKSFGTLWASPDDPELAEGVAYALAGICALTLAPGEPELAAVMQTHYRLEAGAAPPDRESLFIDACLAAQDLRMIWVDATPRGQTLRAAPIPGRNDPCSCGSGKKYKKCHGTAA